MGEIAFEQEARKLALEDGWFVAKLVSPGVNGFPDRMFAKAARIVFVEFKDFGEPATRQQEIRHAELRDAGCEVYVIDNLAEFKRVFGL